MQYVYTLYHSKMSVSKNSFKIFLNFEIFQTKALTKEIKPSEMKRIREMIHNHNNKYNR